MQFQLKKNKRFGAIIVSVFLILLLAVMLSSELKSVRHFHYTELNNQVAIPVGEISRDRVITQEIPLHGDADGISILFATYMRTNRGDVTVRAVGKNSEILYFEKTFPAAEFSDNSYVDLLFQNKADADEDDILRITVSSTSKENEALTIWASNEDIIPNCSLDINGEEQPGDLICRTVQRTNSYLPDILSALSPVIWCAVLAVIAYSLIRSGRLRSTVKTVLHSSTVCVCSFLFFLSYIFHYYYFNASVDALPFPVNPALFLVLSFLALLCFDCQNEYKILLCSVATVALASLLHPYVPGRAAEILIYYSTLLLIWAVIPLLFKKEKNHWKLWMKPELGKALISIILSAVIGSIFEIIFSGAKEQHFLWTRAAFFYVVLFILIFGFTFRKSIFQKPEKLFLLVAIPIGLYFSVCDPIASIVSWDDQIHYSNTIHFTQGDNAIFSDADSMISNTSVARTLSLEEQDNNIKLLRENDAADRHQVISSAEKERFQSLAYLPSAVGIWTGRILNLPFELVYIFGRIGNLLGYVCVIYFAMRRLINGKIILMVIALFPTAVFLASNYSYDPWVTAFAALGIGYFMGAIQRPEEKLTVAEAAIMITALLVAILPKASYFPIVLLPLLMPNGKFSSREWAKKFRIAVLAATGMAFLVCVLPVLKAAVAGSLTDTRGGSDVHSREQIDFILEHPFSYAGIMLSFLKDYLSPENSMSYISFLAYMGLTMDQTLAFAVLCTATATDCINTDQLSGHWWFRTINAVILLAALSVGITALYITFTPLEADTVNGFQPRYLIPVLFPFYLVTCSNRIQVPVNRAHYNLAFSGIMLFLLSKNLWDAIVSNIVP